MHLQRGMAGLDELELSNTASIQVRLHQVPSGRDGCLLHPAQRTMLQQLCCILHAGDLPALHLDCPQEPSCQGCKQLAMLQNVF